MRIVIADDDAVSRRLLEVTLSAWGHEVDVCKDGQEAVARLTAPDGAPMAILDWMMPELDGPSVCRHVREADTLTQPRYLMLLTSLSEREEMVAGLAAGADDYVTKPFHESELRARLGVGERVVSLQTALTERVVELEDALAQIKQLHGMLPICAYCKKIRNDQNYWDQVEDYLAARTDVRFSHGVCPDCYEKVAAEMGEGGES